MLTMKQRLKRNARTRAEKKLEKAEGFTRQAVAEFGDMTIGAAGTRDQLKTVVESLVSARRWLKESGDTEG